jgi:uncharacterized membrane protein
VGYRNGSAFLVESGGGFADLGIYSQNAYSEALGINTANNVVGYEGSSERAEFLERRGDGSYLKNDLGNLGFTFTQAVSINDANQIVGFTGLTSATGSFVRAFRWQKVGETGMMTELGAIQDSWDSYATRINNKGEIVGYSSGTDEFGNFISRACLWGSNGLIELKSMIPAVDSRFIDYGVAYGVNDSTVVVGMQFVRREVDTQFVDEPRAFIWDAQNGMRDLNALTSIPEGSGWVLAAATAINNNGEIVGYGYANGSSNVSAFLLIPPPKEEEPMGPREVDIDIRPWNYHNIIHRTSWWGLVPIAILSTPDFNAVKDVDRKSLTFGPSGDETHAVFCTAGARDVNRDRQKDLICYFHERPAKFQCGNATGTVKGKTKKGEEFKGEDSVQVVPCPPPKKQHRGR